MQTQLYLEPPSHLAPRLGALGASVAKTPGPIAERVVAAPAAPLPDEYWFPAARRPRRASLWNTLNHTRHNRICSIANGG